MAAPKPITARYRKMAGDFVKTLPQFIDAQGVLDAKSCQQALARHLANSQPDKVSKAEIDLLVELAVMDFQIGSRYHVDKTSRHARDVLYSLATMVPFASEAELRGLVQSTVLKLQEILYDVSAFHGDGKPRKWGQDVTCFIDSVRAKYA